MSSRKEEERNEKIIRGLMKLPPNRRCINCNSLGPQYVCTDFWTFVCMTCSGIHREFTHRVKSVSMSKFATQEVEALQKGGNQRAREMYLKDWDPQKQRLPNSSNADKVREFIKIVYVDRRYAEGKTSDKPPVDMLNARLREKETRRASSYHSYSQSPPYDSQYEERRYGKQVPVLTRKPGSDQGLYEGIMSSFSSPSRFSDQMHEDRFGNEGSNSRASDYSVSSSGDPFRSDAQSPNFQRDIGYSSPTYQTPGDILNEHSAKADADRVPRPQRTASASSFGSFDSKTVSVKSVSLVDVASEPESSAETHHDKQHAIPSFPQSSMSGNFGGLDLFSEPFMPQNFTCSASVTDLFQSPETPSIPPVDLFQLSSTSSVPASHLHQSSQTLSSSLDFFSEVPHQQPAATLDKKLPDVIPKNEGWAIFDLPQHTEPSLSVEDSGPAITPLTDGGSLVRVGPLPSPSTSLQWRAFEDTNAHGPSSMLNLWHDGPNNAQVSHNTTSTQSWNAFEDSIGLQSIGSIQQNSEEVSMHAPSTIGNQHLGDFGNDGIQSAASDSRPILGVPLNVNGSSYAPSAGAEAHTADCKSMNPFDLPYDSDTESHNMFLDMSSLQAALPSGHFPNSFPDSVTQPWFPQNQVMPYTPASQQGALGFMGGQAASTQVPNVPSQGPVAYVGGNPFA